MISQGFNHEKEEDIAFIWDVWYNLEWPESTVNRFQEVLKKLLNKELPENVSIPNISSHLESLKKVLNVWFADASKNKSLIEKVYIER